MPFENGQGHSFLSKDSPNRQRRGKVATGTVDYNRSSFSLRLTFSLGFNPYPPSIQDCFDFIDGARIDLSIEPYREATTVPRRPGLILRPALDAPFNFMAVRPMSELCSLIFY
jgi:hypothetical protein